MNGRIAAVFSCCGKTHAVTKLYNKIDMVDHDFYDWKFRSTYSDEEWLEHYVERAFQLKKKFDWVLINATPEILDKFGRIAIIYPERQLKNEWVNRAKARGGITAFPKLLEDNWNSWIDACENKKKYHFKKVLSTGQYLTDLMELIYK